MKLEITVIPIDRILLIAPRIPPHKDTLVKSINDIIEIVEIIILEIANTIRGELESEAIKVKSSYGTIITKLRIPAISKFLLIFSI
jgi:hypothetical protein